MRFVYLFCLVASVSNALNASKGGHASWSGRRAYKSSLIKDPPLTPPAPKIRAESVALNVLGPFSVDVPKAIQVKRGQKHEIKLNFVAQAALSGRSRVSVRAPKELMVEVGLPQEIEFKGMAAGQSVQKSLTLQVADGVKPGAYFIELVSKKQSVIVPVNVDSASNVVDIFSFNDFHGRIGDTLDDADALGLLFAGYLYDNKKEHDYIIASVGDDYGGSGFVSAIQQDVPTYEYLSLIHEQVKVVGNHEFDNGWDSLMQVTQNNLSIPTLGANIFLKGTQELALKDRFAIIESTKGHRVAFIGVVTETVPALVLPKHVEGLTFSNAAVAANTALDDLEKSGEKYDALILLVHMGAADNQYDATGLTELVSLDAVLNRDGEFSNILNNIDVRFDAVLSGHTHKLYAYSQARVGRPKRPILQTGCYAERMSHLELTFNAESGELTDIAHKFIENKFESEAQIQRFVDEYEDVKKAHELIGSAIELAEELGQEPKGAIDGDLTRSEGRDVESRLSNVVADAFLWLCNQDAETASQIGIMNPGGVRTDIRFDEATKGVVTFMQLYSVVPFGNDVLSLTLTGQDIHAVLEQQWIGSSRRDLVLGISGMRYRLNATAPLGQRVSNLEVQRDGTYLPMGMTIQYKIATNNYLMLGGDEFSAFLKAQHVMGTGRVDNDALISYFESVPVVSAFAPERALAIDWVDRTDNVLVTVMCELSTDEGRTVRLASTQPFTCGAPMRVFYRLLRADANTERVNGGPLILGPQPVTEQFDFGVGQPTDGTDSLEVSIFCDTFKNNPIPLGVSIVVKGLQCGESDSTEAFASEDSRTGDGTHTRFTIAATFVALITTSILI